MGRGRGGGAARFGLGSDRGSGAAPGGPGALQRSRCASPFFRHPKNFYDVREGASPPRAGSKRREPRLLRFGHPGGRQLRPSSERIALLFILLILAVGPTRCPRAFRDCAVPCSAALSSDLFIIYLFVNCEIFTSSRAFVATE